MVLPIVAYGNNILKEKAKPIAKSYSKEKLQQLIQNMKETVIEAGGVGLAAPQINESLSVFITFDFQKMAQEGDDKKYFRTFINPEILESSRECISSVEGCLSIPKLRIHIYRPSKIKVKYLNENFEEQEEEVTDYYSCVFQHEHDHLKGTLITDHIKKKKKKKFEPTLQKIEEGTIEAGYEMIFS